MFPVPFFIPDFLVFTFVSIYRRPLEVIENIDYMDPRRLRNTLLYRSDNSLTLWGASYIFSRILYNFFSVASRAGYSFDKHLLQGFFFLN